MSIKKVNGIYVVSCDMGGVTYIAESADQQKAWNAVIKALSAAKAELFAEANLEA